MNIRSFIRGMLVPRSSAQNEAMRLATLEKVWAAAIELFARRGFAATSMRDIAHEAGISTGSIYRHYPTKDDLFAALVEDAIEGLRAIVAAFGGPGSPVEILGGFTREFVDDIAKVRGSAEFVLIMNQALASRRGSAPVQALLDQHAAVIGATVALIRRGQELGELRDGDATELASCYFATLGGLATMKAALGDGWAVPRPATLTGLLERSADDRDRAGG